MREFLSEDVFTIGGRGNVYVVTPNQEIPLAQVLHNRVTVDGTVYGVKGIERFAKWRTKEAPLEAGEKIGLLVERCGKYLPSKDCIGCICFLCLEGK